MDKENKYSSKWEQLKDSYKISLRLLKIVWKVDKKLFILSFVAVTIPAVVPFINIYIYKLVIDLVVGITGGTTVFDPYQFYPLIALRILTYFLQDAAFRTENFIDRLMWTKVPIYLNQLILSKISNLDIHYFEDPEFRNLLEKVRDSYEFRPQRQVMNLFYLMQSVIQVLIAFVALVQLNWLFIILIMIVSIPEFINQTLQSKIAWGIWNDESVLKKRYYYLTNLLVEKSLVQELKIFKLAKRFLSELKNLQQTFYENNKKIAKRSYLSGLLFNGISSLVFIGVEIFVIFESISKRITIGDIAFYTGVVTNFQNGLGGLLRNLTDIFDSSLYVKSIFDLLDSEPVIKQSINAVKLDFKGPPEIEFNNINFTYPGSTKKVLDNFSLKINPGEKVAFVGENGAGKSTLIKLLARFYDVDTGEILIDGINIKNLDIHSWYEVIGILFQDFNRYEDPVKENIFYGKANENFDLTKVITASTLAGSHEMVEKFDKKYDQMLGQMFEDGMELSGGQWQKIALARAFFRNAPILVLDEPTASIDAKAESEIFERVEKLSKDKTVIIISHRFSTVRNADKIYVIAKGKITESGTHQQLIGLDKQYAKLFKLQAKGYQ